MLLVCRIIHQNLFEISQLENRFMISCTCMHVIRRVFFSVLIHKMSNIYAWKQPGPAVEEHPCIQYTRLYTVLLTNNYCSLMHMHAYTYRVGLLLPSLRVIQYPSQLSTSIHLHQLVILPGTEGNGKCREPVHTSCVLRWENSQH